MRRRVSLILALLASATAMASTAQSAEPVVTYTNADLLRLFGPPAPGEAAPVPEADWSLVEGVLAREQERRTAERQFELERARAEAPAPDPEPVYPVVWRLGFPASVWWKNVWCAYSGSEGSPGIPGLAPPCPKPDPPGVYRPY